MSSAYIRGQEEQALAYFEMLLRGEHSPDERKVLEKLVGDLKKEVAGRQARPARENQVVQNPPSSLVAA